MTDPIEPISPEEARNILQAAIRERLGRTGRTTTAGRGHQPHHMAPNKGRTSIDFYVDLLATSRQEKRSAPGGRPGECCLAAAACRWRLPSDRASPTQ
jgi:hypothetical protein